MQRLTEGETKALLDRAQSRQQDPLRDSQVTVSHQSARPGGYGASDGDKDEDELPPETPLPWDQLITLLIVRITEPINFTMIFPFMYFMVRDFGVAKDPKDISWYVGILASSFSVCQTITVVFWGSLSDRIGRRPVMLIGLIGNIFGFLLFGLSKNFATALVARCMVGLLNGNVGVAKSIMGELTDNTNRSRGFALLPLCWNLGAIIGPAIGGMLARPAEIYPGIFGGIWLFETFPYALPCMVGSALSVFGAVHCYLNLKETLHRPPSPKDGLACCDRLPGAARAHTAKGSYDTQESSTLASSADPTNRVASEAAQPGPHRYHLRDGGDKGGSGRPEGHGAQAAPPVSECDEAGLANSTAADPGSVSVFTPLVRKVLLLNCIFSLAFSISDEVYPVWAASETEIGGLGFDTRMISFSLGIIGFIVIYLQLYVYPKTERRRGSIWCYRRGLQLLTPYHVAIPFLSRLAALAQSRVDRVLAGTAIDTASPYYYILWTLLILLLLLRVCGTVFCFTSINIILTNVAPSTSALGKLNGMQQLIASIMRMTGPLLAGGLWSISIKHTWPFPFNSHLVWNFSAVLFLWALGFSQGIPDTVNRFEAMDREAREDNDEMAAGTGHTSGADN